MPRGNPHGYLTSKPVKPATQSFQGENAGGTGTFGTLNDGASHRQPYDPKGSFGPDVASGDASGEAKRLIQKSTGMSVEGSSHGDKSY